MPTIIWHSRTGGGEAMARAAFAAARAAAGSAVGSGGEGAYAPRLLRAEDALPADVLAARALLFVCPENLGTMSGAMKEFFDRCYYPVLGPASGRIAGRAYATAVAAGSDGAGATAQIDRIATGWRLRRVTDPVIVNFAAQTPEAILARKRPSEAQLAPCRELGAALAEGVRLGIF